MPSILKARRITGHRLEFRNAVVSDAEFILRLRTDEENCRFLSSTSPRLEEQISWLNNYELCSDQAYFVIINRQSERVGTVRLYDPLDTSFCWGSWIIDSNSESSHAIESALIVYHYAFRLGFDSSHFDVRRDNASVWRFHQRFGAVRIRETKDDYFYSIDHASIQHSLQRYSRFLPDGIDFSFL